MKIIVNGTDLEIPQPYTIETFLKSLNISLERTAIAYNGEVVPKDKYSQIIIDELGNIEIIQLMAGG
ncbi:sulfur carrier protein ThiS [Priestia aryabhattai]